MPSLPNTITRTNASVNERLDDLERQLPSIPSKMLGLTRAVTDRAGAVVRGAATAITCPAAAVKRETASVAHTTDVAARTTAGQARSATGRTVAAAGANSREVVGQARAQTARVAEQAQSSVENLLDDATAAVETDAAPVQAPCPAGGPDQGRTLRSGPGPGHRRLCDDVEAPAHQGTPQLIT